MEVCIEPQLGRSNRIDPQSTQTQYRIKQIDIVSSKIDPESTQNRPRTSWEPSGNLPEEFPQWIPPRDSCMSGRKLPLCILCMTRVEALKRLETVTDQHGGTP